MDSTNSTVFSLITEKTTEIYVYFRECSISSQSLRSPMCQHHLVSCLWLAGSRFEDNIIPHKRRHYCIAQPCIFIHRIMAIKSTPSSTRLFLLYQVWPLLLLMRVFGGSHVHWGFPIETRSGAQGSEKWKNVSRFSLSLILYTGLINIKQMYKIIWKCIYRQRVTLYFIYIYLIFIFIGIIYKWYGRLILHHSFYRKIDSQWRRLFSKRYIEEIARNSKQETMREKA